MKWSACLIVGLLAFLLVGCGSSGPTTNVITGTVELDGSSLPQGDIVFTAITPGLHPGGSPIKDGKYTVNLENGSYSVAIRAMKEVPLGPGEPSVSGEKTKLVPIVPEKYNINTELKTEISGAGTKDFKVTST